MIPSSSRWTHPQLHFHVRLRFSRISPFFITHHFNLASQSGPHLLMNCGGSRHEPVEEESSPPVALQHRAKETEWNPFKTGTSFNLPNSILTPTKSMRSYFHSSLTAGETPAPLGIKPAMESNYSKRHSPATRMQPRTIFSMHAPTCRKRFGLKYNRLVHRRNVQHDLIKSTEEDPYAYSQYLSVSMGGVRFEITSLLRRSSRDISDGGELVMNAYADLSLGSHFAKKPR